MPFTLHVCDDCHYECTGGGDNPHVCEVDSVKQRACSTCRQFPTDDIILYKVMRDHLQYTKDPHKEKEIHYRDKREDPPEPSEPQCVCPPLYLFNFGHQPGCCGQ